jgi:hypothetical protein
MMAGRGARRGSRRGTWQRSAGGGAVLAGLILGVVGAALAQSPDEPDAEPIRYSSASPRDAVAELQRKIDQGSVTLKRDPVRGYLPAVLEQLGIPVSSQTLVFSKTSFQRDRISPQTPRALYFNERAYVGWVQDGPVLELTGVEPQLGAVFYTLSQDAGGSPKFVRQTHECLSCHGSTLSGGIPGHVVRSVFADATGLPHLSAGTFVTTDESPMKERWGGWYVTGTHGEQRHMGNLISHSVRQAEDPDLDTGANVKTLRGRFDTEPYLTGHSDIVALMVMEHQTRTQNLITRASYETRRALHFEQLLNRDLGRPADFRSDSTLSRVKSAGEPLVRGLLFAREAPLTGPVAGTSTFARDFMSQGKRDKQNRSLRDLDLKKRLFQHPASYLIYSDAFDALPELAKDYVYRRLREILTGQDTSPDFGHLSPADRQAVLEILLETKPEFARWKQPNQG